MWASDMKITDLNLLKSINESVPSRLPKSDDDVALIVKSLKAGIKNGTHGEKIYKMIGDQGLTDLIGALKSFDTATDVTPAVTNHIAQMDLMSIPESNRPYVKKIQESIYSSPALISHVLVDLPLNESKADVMTAIKEEIDLALDESVKSFILVYRAKQLGIDPNALKKTLAESLGSEDPDFEALTDKNKKIVRTVYQLSPKLKHKEIEFGNFLHSTNADDISKSFAKDYQQLLSDNNSKEEYETSAEYNVHMMQNGKKRFSMNAQDFLDLALENDSIIKMAANEFLAQVQKNKPVHVPSEKAWHDLSEVPTNIKHQLDAKARKPMEYAQVISTVDSLLDAYKKLYKDSKMAVEIDFKKKFGITPLNYLLDKAGHNHLASKKIREDVVDFPADKIKRTIKGWQDPAFLKIHAKDCNQGEYEGKCKFALDYCPELNKKETDVIRFPFKDNAILSGLVKKYKHEIDQSDLADPDAKWLLVNNIEAELDEKKLTIKDFMDSFENEYNIDFHYYLLDKSKNDQNKSKNISEAIDSKVAKKCRKDLHNVLKRLVDSADIAMFSNFESFEDKNNIVLKMAVYEPNSKKMDHITKTLKSKLKKEGWAHGVNEDKFIKGTPKDGVMITVHSPRKTFRSGAYRNREILTLPIEILGSKKILK